MSRPGRAPPDMTTAARVTIVTSSVDKRNSIDAVRVMTSSFTSYLMVGLAKVGPIGKGNLRSGSYYYTLAPLKRVLLL